MIKHHHHRLHTFITEYSFTSHQSLKVVITNHSSSGNKVVSKQHKLSLYYMSVPWSSPNKSATEDREGDHAHDLFIVRSRMMAVSVVAVIHDIICNRGK